MQAVKQYQIFDVKNNITHLISLDQWQENIKHKDILLRYFAMPIKTQDNTLLLAIDDEKNIAAIEAFSFINCLEITPVLVKTNELKFLLEKLTPNKLLNDVEEDSYDTELYNQEHLLDRSDPLINTLDEIFIYSLKHNVSDIHIEPQENETIIRLRIDGMLQNYQSFTKTFAKRLISRIKMLAKLDISEIRLSQDGQFTFKTVLNDHLDFRVSTLACYYGEKIVLRLQKNGGIRHNFTDLGFNHQQEQVFKNALNQSQGLILVTGPTGSGKSITLYSGLNYINDGTQNIMTAEDPIEINLQGITQAQVNEHLGIDFASLIRSFLRQDPDVIMVGEIRDRQSAKMAINAAQTGHLVLATLHTNNALSAIDRLKQFGIEDFEIESTLLLSLAQRLLRKTCNHCLGTSCEHCFNGYKGRIGTFQIACKKDDFFNRLNCELDFPSLYHSALEKHQQGLCDLKEIYRVVGYE